MPGQIAIYLIAGARPNFMKIAPLWHALKPLESRFETRIVHTGQHYDFSMSDIFLKNLGLPTPDFSLGVGSGTHGFQTGQVLIKMEQLLLQKPPALVVVVGDVNSTIAAALAAAKLNIPVAHIEAGLRSFDMTMPEEINRILTDRISDLLFASEPSGTVNLKNEGINEERVYLVGNLMIDSLKNNLREIRNNGTAEKLNLKGKKFGLVTMHRPSNVDNRPCLEVLLSILKQAASQDELVFPIHPRTRKNLNTFGLENEFNSIKNLKMIGPVGYFDFINLMISSSFILTDSGGIQEESTWLGIPCITLRDNTERPLTVEKGTNRITGLDLAKVSSALDWARHFDKAGYTPPPLWDGNASKRVVQILNNFFDNR
jgi:UDP-N-acetylglucosamine 2-epimerase (non-hydrolysing)